MKPARQFLNLIQYVNEGTKNSDTYIGSKGDKIEALPVVVSDVKRDLPGARGTYNLWFFTTDDGTDRKVSATSGVFEAQVGEKCKISGTVRQQRRKDETTVLTRIKKV